MFFKIFDKTLENVSLRRNYRNFSSILIQTLNLLLNAAENIPN